MWSIGKVENLTETVPFQAADGQTKFAKKRRKVVTLFHHNIDNTFTNWVLSTRFVKREKRFTYSIRYPASVRDVDKRGYHRPNGTVDIPNAETGLDGESFLRRLLPKFGREFTREIVKTLGQVVRSK
jgi:hypothetical protein